MALKLCPLLSILVHLVVALNLAIHLVRQCRGATEKREVVVVSAQAANSNHQLAVILSFIHVRARR